MKKCPYCGLQTVETISYDEYKPFGEHLIHYVGEKEHCANPKCPEPNRYLPYQWQERERQLKVQLAELEG